MKRVQITGPNKIEWAQVPKPEAGPNDVLLKMKAEGICGSDAFYAAVGGFPPHQGAMPLGHEPAAEVVEVGANISEIAVGDHVVIDTMAFTDGLLGSGGAQGGFSEFVVVKDFQPNKQLKVISKDVPWHVAALNEPMAVALHGVNRTSPKQGDKVVIFGAGPIGLGAVLGYRSKGVSSIVVVDVLQTRLDKALEIGADAVINSATEDLTARLQELHGDGAGGFVRGNRSGTDIYLDCAGVPSVITSAASLAKHGATLGIVAVHKQPITIDTGEVLSSELTIVWAMGYPTEIFEVTKDIEANWEKYAQIVSHTFPFDQALEALEFANTPGAADKVVVLFD